MSAPGFRRSLTLLSSIFQLSLDNLRVNKLRTFLTLLGIIVGVAAIIAVVTIIEGLNQTVANTFSANGSTVFTLSKNPGVIKSREEFIKIARRRDLTEEDAGAVVRLCRDCLRAGYAVRAAATVKYAEATAENVAVRGISQSVFEIEDIKLASGRAWTESEENAGRFVAVVGADILKNVFHEAAPETISGREIKVNGTVFRIIGTAAPLGSIFGISRDNFVLIPFRAANRFFPKKESVTISFQVADAADLETAKDEVKTIMRARRGRASTFYDGAESETDEGFSVESADVFIGLYKDATDNIYLVTIGVSAVSLVVGGIVVMNIMLVSVTERTKEIGLRIAVGARRRDILEQFLFEAVIIASVGGLFGVFAGFSLANLISWLIGFPHLFNIWSVVLGVAVSSIVGVASGIYPAWRAARLDPVEAMRRE